MVFLYQIFIRLFNLCVYVAALFNNKARLFVYGRKGLFKKIVDSHPSTPGFRLIWFHCSSLGEFEQARPLVEQFKNNPENKVLITFFSPSGYEVRKDFKGVDFVFYLPVDTKSKARKFIDAIKPSVAFFVKYDFWYNYLNELSERKIPTYLVSANFREEQFKGFYGMYLRKVLPFFKIIFLQNANSLDILDRQKLTNALVSGDLRFDRVSDTALKAKKIALIEHFTLRVSSGSAGSRQEQKAAPRPKTIICGSTWAEDEKLISHIPSQISWLKLIIAPHEINEEHILKIMALFPGQTLRYSQISKEPASSALQKLQQSSVLVIDNIGMLSSLYQYADIAYIGGGFAEGIHNILEAVVFGAPVIFGPNHTKFPEAQELIDAGGAFAISDPEGLIKAIALLYSDELLLKMAGMTCKNFVEQRRGATKMILKEAMF